MGCETLLRVGGGGTELANPREGRTNSGSGEKKTGQKYQLGSQRSLSIKLRGSRGNWVLPFSKIRKKDPWSGIGCESGY